MITVKGLKYKERVFEKKFKDLEQLLSFIKHDAIGKECIRLPVLNDDGTLEQLLGGCYTNSTLYYHGTASPMGIRLITDDDTGKILFSSGYFTDGKGHVSTPMREMLEDLEEWTKEEYEFAD